MALGGLGYKTIKDFGGQPWTQTMHGLAKIPLFGRLHTRIGSLTGKDVVSSCF